MAQLLTLKQLRDKIKEDNDLEQEQFITESELLGYINEGIDSAEAIIKGLYQDYFLTEDNLDLVKDQRDYDLPANIYGDKFRHILFDDANRKYSITRIRDFNTLLRIDVEEQFRYILKNDLAGGQKMAFYPTPKSDFTGKVARWYIRNANKLAVDADICDIPEFQNYLYAYVNKKVAGKEKLGQDIQTAAAELTVQKNLMEATLDSRVPDEDNKVSQDSSSYDDFYFIGESLFNF